MFAETNEFEKLIKPLQDIARKFVSKVPCFYVKIKNLVNCAASQLN